MNIITNFIEVECENFMLNVKYKWKKGNAGNYLNSPEEDEIDIKRVYINNYITEENDVIVINKRLIPLTGNELPPSWEEIIVQEISYDVENFM